MRFRIPSRRRRWKKRWKSGAGSSGGAGSGKTDGSIWREQRRHVSAWQSGSRRDIRHLTGTERRLAVHRQEAAPRQQLHREAQTRQEDRKLAAGAMERTGSYQRKTMTRSMITLRPGRSIWTVCLRARLRRKPGAAMLLRPIWILLLRVQ